MDKFKLKWKVFIFLFGFCAILLTILWLFQTVFLNDMYKFIRKQEINKAITLVRNNIDNPDLQLIIDDLAANKEIFITPDYEYQIQTFRGTIQIQEVRRFEDVSKTVEFTLPDGMTIRRVFYAVISPVDATVSTLKIQLYIITGIMILLSVAIAVIISARISKPIEKINDSAKVLAAGRYDTHFGGKGFREIKELSDTLNTAAAELSKVENLRRELMANISHDLRTPLTLIYGYAEMMNDFPSEITTEQTQMIMDETRRLTSLVNDVLDVSRLETGNIILNKLNYNLTESINNTIIRTDKLLKKDGYTINFEYQNEIHITADEVKILQAFYNLLINAVNYSEDDKLITVRQINRDNLVRIEIADNGEGISAEDLPYIWDRYYKSNKKHKRAVTGTGLGLSIVKRIIELHGGSCGAVSEQGKGSIFWFEIYTA